MGRRAFNRESCLFAVLLACQAPALAAELTSGAPPAWVRPIPLEPPPDSPRPEGAAAEYLLLDCQNRAQGPKSEEYRHTAVRILNELGLQNFSQLTVDFDPAFQTLVLHEVRLRRGKKSLDRLKLDQVKLLQRETALEALMYDGTKSANLVLQDVQVGDILEYSYTLRGHNPVFGEHYSDLMLLQGPMPIRRLEQRLLWPSDRPLRQQIQGSELKPRLAKGAKYDEYVWSARDVPALQLEDDLPSWFIPYPHVQLGDFGSWADVVDWGVPLYPPVRKLSPELQAWLTRITERAGDDPARRMIAALRQVQNEIRYLGLEIGPGTHQPTPPATVIDRKFGDCKDKAYLLVTLLRQLGIDAVPALVNTSLRSHVRDWQPTPFAFNHVIVRVRLEQPEKRVYWLDPTLLHESGEAASVTPLDYELALPLEPGATQLQKLPRHGLDPPQREIREFFEIPKSRKSEVRYDVDTIVRDDSANSLRADFASKSREQLEKSYLNFYARVYPGISQAQPVAYHDHENPNSIQIQERYKIRDFWTEAEDKGRFEADFLPQELSPLVARPSTPLRTMPLGQPYPLSVSLTTVAHLPQAWEIELQDIHLSDCCISFKKSVQYSEQERRLEIAYQLKTYADTIPAAETAKHIRLLEQIHDQLGYQLYYEDPAANTAAPKEAADKSKFERLPTLEKLNWPIVLASLAVLFFWLKTAQHVYRMPGRPPDPANAAHGRDLEGLRGWLALLGLGMLAQPIRIAIDCVQLKSVYSLEVWTLITTPGLPAYKPYYAPLLLFELVFNIGHLVFAILLATLYFQKRRTFPRVFIVVSAVRLVAMTLDLRMADSLGLTSAKESARQGSQLWGAMISYLLWSSYLLRSKRSRATFIRSAPGAPPDPGSAPPPDSGPPLEPPSASPDILFLAR